MQAGGIICRKPPIILIIERVLMERINICDIEKESKGIDIKYEELNWLFESQKRYLEKLI